MKKYKAKFGIRLQLLRRTLRERRMLATCVKELTVPDPNIPPFHADGSMNKAFNEYRDLVASVVMACPNLERLLGFYPFYTHQFDRLTHALSTKTKLKEHVWVIGENDEVTVRSHSQLPPGLLDQHQVYQFMHYHYAWSELESLMLCSPGRTGVLESGVFVRVFRLLPHLRSLCVSSFDADDFTDSTLLALPPRLRSLRLEECPGVSDTGLSRWAATPAAQKLESLGLIHQTVESLLCIAKVLASLSKLKKFSIVQHDVIPALPTEQMLFQPILACPTLQHLHWDLSPIPSSSSPHSHTERRHITAFNATPASPSFAHHETCNTHLALSVLHAGFPSLLTLRAPRDVSPPGAIQSICRPAKNSSVMLPGDKYSLAQKYQPQKAQSVEPLPQDNTLQSARIRAQSYIDNAPKQQEDYMKIIVTDHSEPDPEEPTGRESSNSSHFSNTSTDPTDPDDLFREREEDHFGRGLSYDLGASFSESFSNSVAKDIRLMLDIPSSPSPELMRHGQEPQALTFESPVPSRHNSHAPPPRQIPHRRAAPPSPCSSSQTSHRTNSRPRL